MRRPRNVNRKYDNYAMSNNIYVQIRESSVYMTIGKSLFPIVSFLTTVYIIRTLSVDDYGTYQVLLAVMAYIGLFSSLGLPSIFQRYIPEFYERNENLNLRRLVAKGSLWRVALSAVLVLLVILFSSQVAKISKIDSWSNHFKLFSLGIIFALEGQLLGTALTSLFLHKYFAISNIVYVCIRASVLYFFLRAGWRLNGLLLGEVAAYGFLMLMFLYCYYSKILRLNITNSNPPFPMKRIFRYGGFSYLNEMGVMILDVSTDFLIISIFLGPLAVGIYAFANRVSLLLSRILPHVLFREVIQPLFFRRFSKTNNYRDLQKMGSFLIKMIAFCSIPLTFGIFLLGDKIILYVFDPKYISSLKVLWIVAAFLTIRAFQFPLGLILQAIEKVNILLYSKLFSIYNLILDLVVVKFWGITGVALVTGSAILFQNFFIYLFLYKYIKLHLPVRALLIITLNSIMMALSIFWLRKYVVGLASLIVIAAVGVMIYLSIAFVNKAFTQEEHRVINSIIGKPVFAF